MKQVKKLVLMTIMLLMGSMCLAQEPELRDSLSIWDVTTSFTEKGSEIRFHTQPNMKDYWSINYYFLDANGEIIRDFLIEGRAGNIHAKYSDILYSVIEDGTALIVFINPYITLPSIIKERISSLMIIKSFMNEDGHLVRRTFPIEIIDQTKK